MRAKNLLGEKMNKHHSQAIPGMSELKTDQYYGTYKWSKDVAGHDGKKQTAPNGDGGSFKDASVVGGISKTEREMAKKAAGGKVKEITPDGSKEHKDTQTKSPISGNKLKESWGDKEPLFYAKNPDGTKCYARPVDQRHLEQLKKEYANSEIKILNFNRPDVKDWLEARRINLRKFVPGTVQTMGATVEARMSAAVKLQRAWEREQAKSAASRKRGEELLNPPKKEEPKKTTEGMLDHPGQQDSPVASALIRRILLQRTDLLAKYGPEKVGQAIDDVADWVGDVDEIGSSDVSGWVKDVERSLSESLGEARKANTASARAELGKRKRKEDPTQQDKKKQEEDEAWALLQQHMNKKKDVAENNDLDEGIVGNALRWAGNKAGQAAGAAADAVGDEMGKATKWAGGKIKQGATSLANKALNKIGYDGRPIGSAPPPPGMEWVVGADGKSKLAPVHSGKMSNQFREGSLNEFAPDDGGESRKFIPWNEFVDQLKQILHKDFDCKESINQDVIKAKFVPYDPMELGPTQIYSYFERRAGRKGANSVRGQIQVGKFMKGQSGLMTGYHLLKGTEFERYFDLTFDNLYKIANIIKGNTHGRLEAEKQGVAEGWDPDTQRLEQDVRDALENGDDYTAKQYAKMAPTPEAKKYLLNIIKQAMYIDDLGGETDWKGVAEGLEQAKLSPKVIQVVQNLRKQLSGPSKLQAKKTMLVLKTDELSHNERKLVTDTLTHAGITFKIKDNTVDSVRGSWTNTLVGIPYDQGSWTKDLSKDQLDALAGPRYNNVHEVSDKLRNRYVARASDDYGHANFAARASKSHPGLEDYSKEQERRADKRRAGLNRALSDKRRGVEEMDSQGYTGSRDHKSMSTYGNRDRDDKITGPDVHLGPEHMIKSKDLVSHLHKALDRALSKEKKASPAQVQRNKERWAKRQQGLSEGKVAEADAILRQIAEDEDWDLLYKIHGMAGKPTPEGLAGNMIDDMYQDAAIESGHHADDDFEEIYNIVLDRIIEEYGIEESVQVNEVDPRNFDSDIDYYNALRKPHRSQSIDDIDPPEKEDPWAEFDREEARRKAKAAKSAPKVEYSKEEGQAPNGKRYNMSVKFTSPDKFRADFAADNWMDSEWGAKKLVDKEQHEHEGETTVTIYVQDNHKHGYWKPWKDEEPISKGVSFESTNEDVGYKFHTSPKFMPRDTLGTDMSYHWGHGGGNKFGIDSKLGPREDPRFGKRGDGKQGYRPEYQKPSEYSDAKDTAPIAHPNELHKLLAKHGQLNSKLKRLEKNNVASANDLAIKRIQHEIERIEHSINDIGGSDFLRHYTESQQQTVELNKLEESFVSKFADKYKGK